jgi:predicted alpha/beta-fold hydrolase
LLRIYAAVAARHPLSLPVAAVARLRRIRDYDQWVVAPRHGFADAADYYARASVAPRLDRLRVPALLVNVAGDPMVRAATVLPALATPVPRLEVHWLARGGHLGFPAGIDLLLDAPGELPGPHRRGLAGTSPRTVDDQVIAWLRRR